jgi:hypothetical protein
LVDETDFWKAVMTTGKLGDQTEFLKAEKWETKLAR